jgi:hypothetical protein
LRGVEVRGESKARSEGLTGRGHSGSAQDLGIVSRWIALNCSPG